MARHTNPWLNRRYVEQASADYGLGPKGKAKGWAPLHVTQIHSQAPRRSVESFTQSHTESRNGVTLCSSPWRALDTKEQGSPGDCLAEGLLKQPTPRGKPEDMLT
jgi:hypothetical protein